ncbi:hypothetical protein NDU88_004025 [Pleurodeles waltl]|uniref:Uncharacterized protein n=1 Tax=Pleurodeles waltl TaxID=8319 RepID=A0AAV7PJV0_PLEWA|nr:hypothetical protein NDU88_004025 [Pleurodeles waltl]
MAVPCSAVLVTAVPSSAVLEMKGPVQRCLRRRCPVQRCLRRRCPVQRCLRRRCPVQRCLRRRCPVQRCLRRRHRPLGHARRWRNLPVYRPLVDLSTMEERHVILTYRLDRATIRELCAQLEPDLMSPIRQPTGIPPLV